MSAILVSFRRVGAFALLAATLQAAKPPVVLPGARPDGAVTLPNQWSLRPAGHQTPLGSFPVNLALAPSGAYAAILHCGWAQHEIRIVELATQRTVCTAPINQAYYGLAWSRDGSTLYCSGAGDEVVHAFHFGRGQLSPLPDLVLRSTSEIGIPTGLAVGADGRSLYVAEGWGQRVLKVNTTNGALLWQHAIAPGAHWATNDPGGARMESAPNDGAYPYACLVDERRGRLYVTLWAKAAVLVLDCHDGREVTRWWVGSHPTEMALTRDGRLFVAEANLNRVSVLDVETGRALETLDAAFEPNAPPGSMPNSLALDPAERTVYVANADNNAVAAFDISDRRRSVSLGFIPVGWFPTSVRVTPDGKRLLVANGKGAGSAPNPRGPDPLHPRPASVEEYIGRVIRGTLSWIDLPADDARAGQFAAWTHIAVGNTPLSAPHRQLLERPTDNPVPARVGDASPIRHVIYIVKENRTYDQVLGDLPAGNGDPKLCLFGERVTPNAHALAREFVLLDNFYADGEISAVGHDWSMGAYASDFIEKTWPLNYGHNERKKFEYPGEGTFPFAAPSNGYVWDAAARAGLSYRSYGEFAHLPASGTRAQPSSALLKDHIDPEYRPFDLTYPDVDRAARYIADLHRFEQSGDLPRLQILRLGNDHTEGAKPKARTPTALVADNDLALGRIVEAVSHSRFWSDTAIFVLEDDAQNGSDHVDAHRMPAFVISPYTRRHSVDSTLYSTTSMLRTIELILGLEPMSQYDAMAAPMYASFAATPDAAPFVARPAQVDLNARNTELSWGARESERMDFSVPDRADDLVLNEIVWRSVKGADSPMPAPIRAAFFRPHTTSKDADDDGDDD